MAAMVLGNGAYPEFFAEPERERACLERLRDYLTRVGQVPVEKNAQELFTLESGVCDRFNYFVPRISDDARASLLVSGCAVGSEMIIARRYGFREIVGTEVVDEYVEIARQRLGGETGFQTKLYDGQRLDFPDNSFTAVVSGHVIEHTWSPYSYLKEHVRVLAPGGIMFLEFPHRYHEVELHTNLPSLEYLPEPLRSLALRFRASRFSRFSSTERRQYDEIRQTVRPMSLWQIQFYLRLIGKSTTRVLHSYFPVPGICRVLLTK